MSTFNRRADPRGLRIVPAKYGSTWYLEWFLDNQKTNRMPVQRRKAHDTEVSLIEQIVALEKQLRMAGVGIKRAEDLVLKPLTGLTTLKPKEKNRAPND